MAWGYYALLELHSSETRKGLSRKLPFWNICVRAGFTLRDRQSLLKENKVEVYICWNILTSKAFNKSRPTCRCWFLCPFTIFLILFWPLCIIHVFFSSWLPIFLKSFHLDICRPSVFPKGYFFSQQGAGVGMRGTIWTESQEKSCRQFFGSSSLAPFAYPAEPWGTTEREQLVSIWKSDRAAEEKMLDCLALLLDTEEQCKWLVVY